MLNEARTEYEVVNVLDEQYNPGVREAIKSYSQWPTIPQVCCGVVLPMHCLSLYITVLLIFASRLLASYQKAHWLWLWLYGIYFWHGTVHVKA